MDNSFNKIIGQEKVKKRLNFFIQGQNKSLISPNILFVAPRGSGKTLIAQTYASQLLTAGGTRRRLITINCSTLKGLKQFINDLIVPHVSGKEVTILFDEASEIPRDITMALLTVLNPNSENRNTFAYADHVIDFDFRRITFLFATTEAHKIFHALMDRLERVDLEDYSSEQLSMIINKNLDQPIEEEVINQVASVLRGNARKATQMANHIKNYLGARGKKDFSADDWNTFQDQMGINPLGLNPLEIKVLHCLAEKAETTLTNLSAKTHLTRQALQRDTELFLQKLNLIEVTPTGRKLTVKGRQYVADIK